MRETAWPLFFIERSEGMRVLLLFDQIQAGYGGKERADTELGLEKGGIGSFLMFKDEFTKAGLSALATIYCGPDYFQAHKEEVIHKIHNLILKTKAEVLFAGPCFNYDTYAQMAAEIALAIQEQTDCKPYVICSKENEETIANFKDKIIMLEMPKKGAVGLREALSGAVAIISGEKEARMQQFQ